MRCSVLVEKERGSEGAGERKQESTGGQRVANCEQISVARSCGGGARVRGCGSSTTGGGSSANIRPSDCRARRAVSAQLLLTLLPATAISNRAL